MPKRPLTVNIHSDKSMSVAEAAYFAGIVDGEGTITLIKAHRQENRCGYSYDPQLSVCSTTFSMIDALRRMSGNGRITFEQRTNQPNRKDAYLLRFSPKQIRHILPQIRPYLIVKGEQADLVMTFLEGARAGRNHSDGVRQAQDAIRDRLKQLNQRGRIGMLPHPESLH